MDFSGHTSAEQGRSSTHTWIQEDIKTSQHVPFNIFVETLFGLTADRMKTWAEVVAKENWHLDSEIFEALEAFCDGGSEGCRHEQFAKIANRVARMAHGCLPGVPDVFNICVAANHLNYVETIEAQGHLGARRSPSCLFLRTRDASKTHPAVHTPTHTKIPEPQAPSSQPPRSDRKTTRTSTAAEHSPRRMTTRASTRKGAFTAPEAESRQDDGLAPLNDDLDESTLNRHVTGGEVTKSQGVRWVDIIMNVEFTGRTSFHALLQSFIKDRNKRDSGNPKDISRRGAQAKTRGGRDGCGRGKGGVRGGDAVCTGSESNEESFKRRHQFGEEDEDDLLYHIRRPDPHTRTLDGDFDNLDTPARLSYDVKMGAIQTGSYALETLACTFGTRLFCVNIFIKNDRLYLWYYDACGYLYTESISVVADFEKTAALLVAIACSSPAQLGALPSFVQPPQGAPYSQKWPPESLKGHTITIPHTISSAGVQTTVDMPITFADPVFSQYVICGRRSFVYAIKTSSSRSGDERMVKFSYQVDTRRKEHELLEIARLAGVEHLPSVHGWGEHWKMSDGVRKIFYDEAGVDYENRTLRSIVYSKYLPLESLFSHSPQYIPTMAYQLIDCVHDLRYKANMLHRDIVVDNVMYEYRGTKLYFILIDFDTAAIFAEGAASPSKNRTAKNRTGALALMAVDLIRNASLDRPRDILHMLCHEFESIYWLCLWCTLVFVYIADEKHRKHHLDIVRSWETEELRTICGVRYLLRQHLLDSSEIVFPPAAVDARLDAWFDRWTRVWVRREFVMTTHALDCRMAKEDGLPEPLALDYETSDGILSRDNLRQTLTEIIPYYDDTEAFEPSKTSH